MTQKALDDPDRAPIDEKLRATLAFLRKLTLSPDEVTPADAKALLTLGLSREAIVDAAYVCYLFNTYDRLADTLGWALSSDAGYQASAKMLLKRGYA